jgi:ferric-dicitrate binding protein FerR (iron transport regulator)
MELMESYNSELDDLLIRHLIGSGTEEENTTILNWLSESKENRLYFDRIKDVYFLGKTLRSPSGFSPEKSLNRIKYRYFKLMLSAETTDFEKKRTRQLRFRAILAVAASVMLLLSLGFNFRSAFRNDDRVASNTSVVYNEINTPKGSRTQVTLPDGTKVWLNADSKIRYPMDFFKGDRKVILTGEAFFDVKKYPHKRFIVNTSDIAIQVWGTKFNVKAYPDDEMIRTTLVEGSISIRNLKGNFKEKETYLTPNQTAVYYKDKENTEQITNSVDVPALKPAPREVKIENKINTILYTSWKDPKWIIEGQSLGDLARELERRYNVNIRFDNESIKKYRFNGILTDETFEQVLEIIKVSAPINYKIKSNQVLLEENLNSKTKYDQFLNR